MNPITTIAFQAGLTKAAGAYDFPLDPHRTKKLVAAGVGAGALAGTATTLLVAHVLRKRKKKPATAA